MRAFLRLALSAALLSATLAAIPAHAAPPGPAPALQPVPTVDTPDSIAQLWLALPPTGRTLFVDQRELRQTKGMPEWLGFEAPRRGGAFCGFGEDGKTATRIYVRWALRSELKRAIARIGTVRDLERNVVMADLTRSQILAVAGLKGVVLITHDGCSWPN